MRYIIGVDLGTTNSAVAYFDTAQAYPTVQVFQIPQFTSLGVVHPQPTLPSFCYLIDPHEWPAGSLTLPWGEETTTFVGEFAKQHGARVPTRLVQSAKSWLCNMGANRRDKILPIDTPDLSLRLSPVETSAKYLIHLRNAWNAQMAKGKPELEFEEQEIILTVPASFDEVARELTVEAAKQAGFNHLTLLEEPQAAFYSWIAQHAKDWEKHFEVGDRILVCDVGGGTTDFSLIEVQEQSGNLAFQRMAVGDHLLLGGDNMDAALAHFIEQKNQQQFDSGQWLQLLAGARQAKESLLSPKSGDSTSIVLQGAGSSVIGGSQTLQIEKKEVEQLLVEGFFGLYSFDQAIQLKRTRGLRTVGLPYEDEPSITKHLAHFLHQTSQGQPKPIDHLLFNGGALKPESFRNAIYTSLKNWFPSSSPTILETASLDLAVARGAAYYGKVKRGEGVRIGGGLPRAYYLELETADAEGKLQRRALTLLPRGSQEGQTFSPTYPLSLRANQPVAFHLMTSNTRLTDQEGDLISIEETELRRLPPIQTILRFGKKGLTEEQKPIPVKLKIHLSAIGTLELWLESVQTDHRWNLEFQVRSATGHEALSGTAQADTTFASGTFDAARALLQDFFNRSSTLKPGKLMEALEEKTQLSKQEWPPSLLRILADDLLKLAPSRTISEEHEIRWWNLLGYCLRPGCGFPLDDFRIKELWKIVLADAKATKSQECQIQMWISFRRMAAGLNKGQQQQIASPLLNGLFKTPRKSDLYPYSEKLRLLASFERLEIPVKTKLGDGIIKRIEEGTAIPPDYWALGRIGARQLLYASAGQVVPQISCVKWVETLLAKPQSEANIFALSQLCAKTHQRALDLPDAILTKVQTLYPEISLEQPTQLSQHRKEEMFGEQLPPGLVLDFQS